LEEDLLGFPTYPAARDVRVRAGDPMPVSAMLASGELTKKDGAARLTAILEGKLTAMIEEP
jgi:hypothetical protein